MIRAAIRLRKAGMAPWSYARSVQTNVDGAFIDYDDPDTLDAARSVVLSLLPPLRASSG